MSLAHLRPAFSEGSWKPTTDLIRSEQMPTGTSSLHQDLFDSARCRKRGSVNDESSMPGRHVRVQGLSPSQSKPDFRSLLERDLLVAKFVFAGETRDVLAGHARSSVGNRSAAPNTSR